MIKVRHKSWNRIFLSIMLFLALLASGCSSSFNVADDEAVRILQQYFIFYEDGKQISATVVNRKAYNKECDCLPIEFEISGINGKPVTRTYYFYRDRSGEIDVRKFKYGIKGT